MPPRHSKSETVTIHYPAWRLERDPTINVIVGCYDQRLANKFSRRTRRIVRQRIPLDPERTAVEEWQTAGGGGLKAVGVGAGVTGTGGNLIIIDDPVKSRDEADSEAYRERVYDWYTNDLYTRLEPDRSAIILIQTRWHEDDLAGRILESEDGPNWTVLNLPAESEGDEGDWRAVGEPLWPERFDKADLERIHQVLGRDYYALYQQRPQPEGGEKFQETWFTRIDNLPVRSTLKLVVQMWDTAFKEGQENDYSACVTLGMHGNRIFVLNAWRKRMAFPELTERMRYKHGELRPDVLGVEDKGSGTSAMQMLRQETMLPVVAVSPGGLTKVDRANLVTAMCEAGRVSIPKTTWGDDLIDELVRFPSAKHDDMVDAFVYGLMRITAMTESISVVPY